MPIFEWNQSKNESNYKKHGIAFENLKEIFQDKAVRFVDDRFDYGETRYVCLGVVDQLNVTAVYTERAERIRWISARPSSRMERRIYDEFRNAEN